MKKKMANSRRGSSVDIIGNLIVGLGWLHMIFGQKTYTDLYAGLPDTEEKMVSY